MSVDFQLGKVCPHITVDEAVSLGVDRRSMRLRQPIASSNQVRITANGVSIPKEGLRVSATLKNRQTGPFRVTTATSTFEISNRLGSVSVSLQTGTSVQSSEILRSIQIAVGDFPVHVELDSFGVLTLEDQFEKGPSSFLRVSGAALETLGFDFQTRAKGRLVYPSWSLIEAPEVALLAGVGIKDISARYPRFDQALSGNPVVKVSYVTFRERCLRCSRTGVENDLQVLPTGGYAFVGNEDLLYQSGLKILLTEKGSNPFFPQYGSLLTTRIGQKITSSTEGQLSLDCRQAMNRLQSIQNGQGKIQAVTPREKLESIAAINVFQPEGQYSAYGIQIVALNASNQPVQLNAVFTVPGVVSLLNSRGQELGAFGNAAGRTTVFR